MTRPPSPDEERPFLSRWASRKREATNRLPGDAADPPVGALDGMDEPAPIIDTATGATVQGSGAELVDPAAGRAAKPATLPAEAGVDPATPVPALTDADMPPLDSLNERSDLSVFLSDGVSATLRKAALRRVFSGAAFNVRDGLNDYDGDYTAFEPLGDTVTADMKFHAARRERLARERAEAQAISGHEELVDDPPAPTEADAGPGGDDAPGDEAARDAAGSEEVSESDTIEPGAAEQAPSSPADQDAVDTAHTSFPPA